MSLPSQHSRSSVGRSHMYRRKRFRRHPLLVLFLVVIVAGGIYLTRGWWFGGSDDPVDNNRLAVIDKSDNANGTMAMPEESRTSNTRELKPKSPLENKSANNNTNQNTTRESTKEKKPVDPPKEIDDTPATVEQMQRVNQITKYAFSLKSSGRLVESRDYFTQALNSNVLTEDMTHNVHVAIDQINDILIFSPQLIQDDPFTYAYHVKSGETLGEIVQNERLRIDWRFILRINKISDARKVRAGNTLKLIRGPFHAVISKSNFRLDLYLGTGSDRVFVTSFPVGLGEYNSTPVGMFRVSSRVINPEWTNPHTRERYLPDDPANPIGEYWLGLVGTDENTEGFSGYGIHGTIEPDSIGNQQSMGCVRLLPEDIAIVYECLMSDVSQVEIRR